MKDNVGKAFFLDGEIQDSINLDKSIINERKLIYEIVRVIDKTILFLEDHLDRLKSSLILSKIMYKLDEEKIKNDLYFFIKESGIVFGNIKILVYEIEENKTSICFYLSKYYYPTIDDIEKGVKLCTTKIERSNPNAKVINEDYKLRVEQDIKENGAFETLLINSNNEITEGSRSNAFFVKDDIVRTAPKDMILEGITRKYILKACEINNIKIIEEQIRLDEIELYQSMFITGTSIKVLPIKCVDNTKFINNNKNTLSIMRTYDKIIEDYILKNKW